MAVMAVALAAPLAGCAARNIQGASLGVQWRVGELKTSERDATTAGYKSGGRAKVHRYVVVLEDTRGIGVDFHQIETLINSGPGFRPTPHTAAVRLRLPPNGQLRIPMADSTWLVIPQWFEGTERRVSLDSIARKSFMGTDDRGDPVLLVIDFPLEDIPR
jgi:hypothetical protein